MTCRVDGSSKACWPSSRALSLPPRSVFQKISIQLEVFIGLFAGLLCRSTIRLLARWTRVPTSPARGEKCSSSGMKPTTSLWVCTQGPPTPSPSRPAQQRALGPPSPLGSPPKFQVTFLEREKEEDYCFPLLPSLIFLSVKKVRANWHCVIWERSGPCGPSCVNHCCLVEKSNPQTAQSVKNILIRLDQRECWAINNEEVQMNSGEELYKLPRGYYPSWQTKSCLMFHCFVFLFI